MKPILLAFVLIALGLSFDVVNKEVQYAENLAHKGTAVIAAKSHYKGKNQAAILMPKNLSEQQAYLLNYAYKIAKEDGIKPEYFQGLLYQESKLGGVKGYEVAGQEFGLKPLQRYYGIAQLKLVAVKEVLKAYPELGRYTTDEEMVVKLIVDPEWSIRVSSKLFKMLSKNRSVEHALLAYNKGPTGSKGLNPFDSNYVKKVSQHAASMKNKNNIAMSQTKRNVN